MIKKFCADITSEIIWVQIAVGKMCSNWCPFLCIDCRELLHWHSGHYWFREQLVSRVDKDKII